LYTICIFWLGNKYISLPSVAGSNAKGVCDEGSD